MEDWSTIRILCSECSRGNPGPHDCKVGPSAPGENAFGFAARSKDELLDLLQTWAVNHSEADYGDLELLVAAV